MLSKVINATVVPIIFVPNIVIIIMKHSIKWALKKSYVVLLPSLISHHIRNRIHLHIIQWKYYLSYYDSYHIFNESQQRSGDSFSSSWPVIGIVAAVFSVPDLPDPMLVIIGVVKRICKAKPKFFQWIWLWWNKVVSEVGIKYLEYLSGKSQWKLHTRKPIWET